MNKESVDKAVSELHKSKLEGRTIIVERSQSNKDVREHVGHTVFIKNLSYQVKDDELHEYCEQNFGEIKKLTLVKDDKGHSKGIGFVEFINEESMNKALKQKDLPLKNRIGTIMKSVRQITTPKQQQQLDNN